ncbi:MAG: hypothetical protein COZ06_28275 [Armatimonadetes bacterium CG_4_10_14_3_um_filter_66_18]|nr:hypothetical protein [Armatimonadota bacterium]OIO93946.1 MAG: hypothetical protein AUJ96_29390 [Armatimonadetes bacterium CG2_30_66_41]PIU93443.1 MAG: hypothetical protein COS65_12695 [Armatimonadetes bacterium CG06_land_8_20_14_3_00_66_21]PIX45316.1 MAG: hypothetical protein COZ57_15790 [Armatimonadetes bacterium CG_4_8_14_3_um_filter_66_20]PIY40369.1 MAG: hypothetical protein COZ06_28275 [Armatimonadetes bacterium CG_4_10_14_3_um_filter_66_18]PIZ45268.1 MAG: hypothetical protein COY42_12
MLNSFATIAAVALLAPMALAQCGAKPDGSACQKPKLLCLAGTVKSLDAAKRDLVVTLGTGKDAKDVALKVCPKVKIQIDAKEAKLDAVKLGAAAKLCTITTDKGVEVAVAITIGNGECPNEGACCSETCPQKGDCKADCANKAN